MPNGLLLADGHQIQWNANLYDMIVDTAGAMFIGSSAGSITLRGALASTMATILGSPPRIQIPKSTIAQVLAITCNTTNEGQIAFIHDTAGAATPTFHLAVAGSGATAVDSLTTCNGSNWVYD
jgi:hypothetical protein